MPRRTPLNDVHRSSGARMVDFVGWDMPVQYSGVEKEHLAVRTAAGLFDVSHMGEVEFTGPGALETANRLITNDLTRAADGQAVYAGLLDERGTFVDDVVAYRFGPQRVLICVNASNREKDVAHMVAHAQGVTPRDVSDDYAQLAIQGPAAAGIVAALSPVDLTTIGTYRFTTGAVAEVDCIISRTGYTGEDGFELYCAPDRAVTLWTRLMEAGAPRGLVPAGLGARDSLRTEMKFALYGNDIDEHHTPLEAGLGWIVKLDKPDFLGKAALVAQKASGVPRKLVGFVLTGPGIPRPHYPILSQGQRVGEVTSGTMGPSVKKAIGMGYVPPSLAAVGSTFEVEIRGRPVPAEVVPTPFYKRS